MTPSLLFSLAAKNNVALPPVSEDPAFASPETLTARYDRFSSLSDFLHYYFIGMSVLRTKSDFTELASLYFGKAATAGVVHAEVFFDPQVHTARGIDYATVRDGFTAACARAKADYGISSMLIVCLLRHLPVGDSQRAFDEVLPDLRSGAVAGLGLSSNEFGNPPSLFTDIYAQAGREGIRRTAHAGEEAPAAYAKEALDVLGVQRIDHGIRVADDQELIGEVVKRGLLLTICPVSNVKLRCVGNVSELPIRKFLDAGVRFSINGDDPAYFGAYIGECYCAVQEAFGLSGEEWERVCVNAINGSWCSDERKEELKSMLDGVMLRWRNGELS
ncbi:MAG: adenine deaminase [Vezdaea aestivalis]|nr:MAG: adenine deaminase [Vezdaea aestivalis]